MFESIIFFSFKHVVILIFFILNLFLQIEIISALISFFKQSTNTDLIYNFYWIQTLPTYICKIFIIISSIYIIFKKAAYIYVILMEILYFNHFLKAFPKFLLNEIILRHYCCFLFRRFYF